MVKPIDVMAEKKPALPLPIIVCALLFGLGGCQQDYSLAPPADSEKIIVTVKLPKELKTETMWVMYRSTTCRQASYGASGQRTERDGYHSVYKELERQGQSDLYQVELPKDGGGACRWHLANVTFGVAYADPTHFGENVTFGTGGGVVVIFDHNNSPRGAADIQIDGDLTIRKEYYPWVGELFIGGYKKYISLAGEGGTYLKYQASAARQVYFEPIIHSEFIVRSKGAKVHKIGDFMKFTYPDGSVVAERYAKPDFLKLQTMRTGRHENCFSRRRYADCPDRRPQLLPGWQPMSEMPGFGHYVIANEWGNALPSFTYRLVGADGQVFEGRTDEKGRTKPLPDSTNPVREVGFPPRKW